MKKLLPALVILIVLIAALSGCIKPIVINPMEVIVNEYITSVSTENLDRLMAIYDDPVTHNDTTVSWDDLKSSYAFSFALLEIHSATIVSKTTNFIDGTINLVYDLDSTASGTRSTRRITIFMRTHLVGLNWKVYLEEESTVTP